MGRRVGLDEVENTETSVNIPPIKTRLHGQLAHSLVIVPTKLADCKHTHTHTHTLYSKQG